MQEITEKLFPFSEIVEAFNDGLKKIGNVI